MTLVKIYIDLKLAQSLTSLRVKELKIFDAENTLVYGGSKLKLSLLNLLISIFAFFFPRSVIQGHEMYEREKRLSELDPRR